jgi:hypothetical protein
MSEQIKAKSGSAGVPAYTDRCSQSGATHTVNPLLASSLIGSEEDSNGLKQQQQKNKDRFYTSRKCILDEYLWC